MSQKTLFDVAIDVRVWAEARAEGTYMASDLNGMCAIATAELHRRFSRIGLAAEIHAWVCPHDGQSAHVFLVVDDYVVDVTATQFSKMRGQRIYVRHLREAEEWDWYQSQRQFNNIAGLLRWQKKHGWPAEQRVWI